MQTNNITIIGVYDTKGNQITSTNPLVLEAKESTVNIRIRFITPRASINNIQSIKVESWFFGDVLNTINSIYAIQGNIIIVDSIFTLKYPSNTTVMRNEVELDYLIEGNGIYFSTLNDNTKRISLQQPTAYQIELGQFGNYRPNITRYLEQDGLRDGRVLLGTIAGSYISDVWLETITNDTFNVEIDVEKTSISSNLTDFAIYLTNYPPNYSDSMRAILIRICGTSTSTGKRIPYLDQNLNFRQTASNMNPDITLNIPSTKFTYKGEIISGSIQYTNGKTTLGTITVPSWMTLRTKQSTTEGNIVTQTIEITVQRNTLTTDKNGVISIVSTIDGNEKENKYQVVQYTEPNRTNIGVWDEIYCTFQSNDVTMFQLCDDETDTTIYQGYAYPVGGVCNINLKDIINNYISQDIQFLYKSNEDIEINKPFGKMFSDINSSKVFYIKVNDEIIQTYHVVYNWSFEPDYIEKIENKVYLQMPIQGIIDYRQFGFLSRYHFNEIKDMRDEDVLGVEIPYINPFTFFYTPLVTMTNKINHISYKIPRSQNPSYNRYINKANIKVNSQIDYTYKICRDNCHKYCLYYVNKYGGIDWFLFGKTSSESRSLKYEKAKFGDNDRYYSRNVKQSWVLRTEYLTDAQSKLMPNLLESTCLYLHDLETDEIYPINIVDTKYEIKQKRNQKRKFYNYVINVESQQDRKIIG